MKKAEGRMKKQLMGAARRAHSAFCMLPSTLHRDDSGNLGVLFLLSIWAFIALFAIVWNTGEVATRKQTLQTAADTSAHSTATWISRDINLITAQNMIICEDASMEAIWRAVTNTDTLVSGELTKEQLLVEKLLSEGNPTLKARRNRMLRELVSVDDEFAQVSSALSSIKATGDPKFDDTLRQANLALGWVQNTYVGGGAPENAQWPGPPGPGGQGLQQLVSSWGSESDTADKAILNVILQYLQQEVAVLKLYEARALPAMSTDVPTIVSNHEQEVFQNETQMVDQLNQSITDQLSKQQTFYNVRLTLANANSTANNPGSGTLAPPVVPASSIDAQSHSDSITGQTVQIDPINVQCNNNPTETDTDPTTQQAEDPTLDARIRYGSADAPVPAAYLALYPKLPPTFAINCDTPDGWGHLWCAPLNRYFYQRLSNDLRGSDPLLAYMQQIDTIRQQLAVVIRQMLGLGTNDTITPLPAQLTDPNPNLKVNPGGMMDVLPRLAAPAGADAQTIAAVSLYNQHGARYTGAVRALANDLENWTRQYDRFTHAFAASTWLGQVSHQAHEVLKTLGLNKNFMVLAPYNLSPLPDWATDGMRVSATAAIKDRIISRNIGPVTQAVINAMLGANPGGAGGGFLDSSAAAASDAGSAAAIALQIVSETANEVAPQIAAEWVSRPWDYELTPPDTVVPPVVGMTKTDRLNFFTVLSAARPNDENAPKLFMGKLLGNPKTPQLLADAQAESFNWMEFNGSYGGNERFDQVASVPEFWGNGEFTGAPLPWRTSTVGGWTWNPRLATTDGLTPALQNNSDFSTFFQEAGITASDEKSMEALVLH